MRRLLTRAFSVAALAGLMLTASCGGTTGLEVRIDLPQTWVPESDFNSVRIQVHDAETGDDVGDTYPVTTLTPKPYVVYVYADGKKEHHVVSVVASAWMNNSIKAEKTMANVVLQQGELKYLVVDLSQQ